MNPLHERIRQLPAHIEFLFVISWAFGLSIFTSILSVGATPEQNQGLYDNAALIGVLIFELTQSVILVWFLRIRGWTLEKLGLSVNLRSSLLGIVLLVVTYGLWIGVQLLAGWALPAEMEAAAARYPSAATDLSMGLVVLASVVNGIFEEVFVAGYVIAAVAPVRGTWTAINVSTGIRLLYHLYQGPIGILTIVPMGVLFGYVYTRTRLLWPLILAHILMDIIGFAFGASGDTP
jgi:membrane protease YdiL (CAAX protease family)